MNKFTTIFQCAEFSLASGWDNWSGYYLLSDSMAGDVFLRTLFDRCLIAVFFGLRVSLLAIAPVALERFRLRDSQQSAKS